MGGGTSKLQQVIAAVEEAEEAFQAGRLEAAIKMCEKTRYCAAFSVVTCSNRCIKHVRVDVEYVRILCVMHTSGEREIRVHTVENPLACFLHFMQSNFLSETFWISVHAICIPHPNVHTFDTSLTCISHSPLVQKAPKLEAQSARITQIQEQATKMIHGLKEKLSQGDSLRRDADAAMEREDFRDAAQQYQSAAQAFRDAILTECGSLGKKWLSAKRPDKMRWGAVNNSLRVRDREVVWKSGGGSAVAVLGEPIEEGKIVCEFRITVQNIRNDESSFFVGVVSSENLDLGGFWYDDAYAHR
jgi:hypothetical protein